MLVLGLLLILLAIGLFLGVAFGGADDTARLEMGVLDAQLSTLAVFLLGAITLLLLLLGLALLRGGASRARQRRRDKKELNRLAKQVEEQRVATAPTTTAPTTTASTTAPARTGEQPVEPGQPAGGGPVRETGTGPDEDVRRNGTTPPARS